MALMADPVWDVDYAEEVDVLYAARGAPQPAASVEVQDDVLLRYVPPYPEVVGITILNFQQHYPLPTGRALHDHAADVLTTLYHAYPKVPIETLEGPE